jgi:hypothetical protein
MRPLPAVRAFHVSREVAITRAAGSSMALP